MAQWLKISAYQAGDSGSILGSGRSPGEGNGNPLQHSCQDNRMDRGAWRATIHGAAKNQTGLNRLSSSNSNNTDMSSKIYRVKKVRKESSYIMVPLTWNSKTGKIKIYSNQESDRNLIPAFIRKGRVDCKRARGNFLSDGNGLCFFFFFWRDHKCTCMHLSKLVKLYTQTCAYYVNYANYISIKLIF